MTDGTELPDTTDAPEHEPGMSRRMVLVLVVVVFSVLIGWKLLSDSETRQFDSTGGDASITSVHNDAVADYDAALATGKPIYVLFHSLTCAPCVEISEVADVVVPDYEGDIVFVNVITDDPSGQELASGFEFQYIPTSFFLDSDGMEFDSHTGAMDDPEMRSRLDALIEGQ